MKLICNIKFDLIIKHLPIAKLAILQNDLLVVNTKVQMLDCPLGAKISHLRET